MVVLNRADVVARVGLDLEIGWLPPLVTGSRTDKILPGQPGDLDCSQFVEPLDVPTTKVDRSQGDIHPMGNPHYWIPPVNAVRIAKGMMERFTQLRPASKEYFTKRFVAFVSDLKGRAAKWEELARPLAGAKVVTYHKSWSYVSKWLKLDEVGYVENKPGIPPSPDHLAHLITQMKAVGAKKIIVESFYNRAIADQVAQQADATVVSAPSDVGATKDVTTYPQLVDALLAALTK
jgi:zinc/manganese transport system substrate-binding protein